MLSVIIKDCHEPKVMEYTFEHLYTELKDIYGSELLVRDSWDITDITNRFICFVEADCLVDEGFFKKQLEVFKSLSPRVAVLSAATAVCYWDNRIYGYAFEATRVVPNRRPKSTRPYPLQAAYIPGSIIRTASFKRLLKTGLPEGMDNDLTYYSSRLSLGIWTGGISVDAKHLNGQLGSQIYINPNLSYVTTEDYVNDIAEFLEPPEGRLLSLFEQEKI